MPEHHIHYLTVSAGQYLGELNWVCCSGSHKVTVKGSIRAMVLWWLDWRSISFQAHMVVGNIRSLSGCWPGGLRFLLSAAGDALSTLSTGPHWKAAHSIAACFFTASKGGTSLSKTDILILCLTELCPIALVVLVVIGPAHTQGGVGKGSLRRQSETICLPQILF